MNEKLLRKSEVLDKIPFGRTWLQDRINAGEFPKPRKYGRTPLWVESSIDEWIENFISSTDHRGNPPITA